ncbi:hypothetical protein RSOLAG1IB_08475 [Rhizoctonia solani AG-1 IB]|uniref:Pyrroloquinoline quinone-dependent pyranose dehydrogenase beta-propeller domain-containing protein n=1 Tax=Thanatephorus cucumeris (strain AG1-IB / isolate 7/3/14) TaxID=1108050 RepID=A0A0B7FM25_THACB|nr:hypothetical protein RSOLAG1IB_08475 [Rhizoctonia solani AG-1 IB]
MWDRTPEVFQHRLLHSLCARSRSVILFGNALSVFALPTSPSECKSLSSLSFAYPPTVANGLTAHVIYNNVTTPRGIRIDKEDNLLVVERLKGIISLTRRDDVTCAGWEKRTVITQSDLRHGIKIGPIPGKMDMQYLYASSQERVYRWEYDAKDARIIGNYTTLVYNMTNPSHTTRTLLLQPGENGESEYLIVSRGSASKFDESAANINAGPAQIHQFPLTKSDRPTQGYHWNNGAVLAWGVRNGVGIALSKDGKDLWEIENSSDNIRWRDVDIHVDSPAEELNRVSLRESEKITLESKFYGYPSCYTAWNSSSVPYNASQPVFDLPTGAQFSMRPIGTQPDDAWCEDPSNNKPPRLSLQAHTAPLDLIFYDRSKHSSGHSDVGLTNACDGDAISSLHGSWKREPPTVLSVSHGRMTLLLRPLTHPMVMSILCMRLI